MSRKNEKSGSTQTCRQCQAKPAIPGLNFCSHRCEQADLAPKAKSFCLKEKISIRDLVRISGGRFQRQTWHRFLNGQLNDQLWYKVEAIFFGGLIDYYSARGLSDVQIDRKMVCFD
ncbi:MAG TPA: hypothetical protein PLD20_00920 [Blastocatellia bacterium]|nr:hypothetical protein [Blastocatellia bacterium]HMV81809.1 hypothetical protein [Blastocatellia bacterium]HMX24010.1 hypothetical protein [Blastocatellia bacterium]HMY70440.1 hypothetical protein [Blastocatellia bacterium]HMZ16497.1 hypothetical protein [Blastocatellia bacterium]